MQKQGKIPEFINMSQGLGKGWLEKYETDLDKDYIITRFKKHKVPRYYDKKREEKDPEKIAKIKEERKRKALERKHDNTKVRLKSKAIIAEQATKQLPRSLDNGN